MQLAENSTSTVISVNIKISSNEECNNYMILPVTHLRCVTEHPLFYSASNRRHSVHVHCTVTSYRCCHLEY